MTFHCKVFSRSQQIMSHQPKWKLLANLGDANPLDHGGYFIFTDETGVHEDEAEWLEEPRIVDNSDNEETDIYEVRRFTLDRCSYVDGILSDNKFHRDHHAWFATPESEKVNRPQDTTYLSNLTAFMDSEEQLEDLIRDFCSADSILRAGAYCVVGQYHGWDNLDSDPLIMSRQEAEERYCTEDCLRPIKLSANPTLHLLVPAAPPKGYYGWRLINGEQGHVTLKDALHNLSASENGDSHEHSRGLIVGVMATFMACGMTFDEASKLVWQHLPLDCHPERFPPTWKDEFTSKIKLLSTVNP